MSTNPGIQQSRSGVMQESRPGGLTERNSEAGKPSPTQDLREKAVEVKDGIRDMAGMATDVGREQWGHLKDVATETYEEGREQLRNWQDDLEKYVRNQPLKSMLIVGAIGIALGVFWRRT